MDLDATVGVGLAPECESHRFAPSSAISAAVLAWSEGGEEDSRVVHALEVYLARCDRGDRPDRADFLEEHQDIATRLSECLDSLDYVERAAYHFHPPDVLDTSPHVTLGNDLGPPERLGDYRIIREIGRGGMGVVYEAEQVSLGRRVALKLLPFTASMDPKQVQRFQVEVQAAAHLHHPHIVPIYAVGREAGIHFYVMQLIPGRSLAAVLGELVRAREAEPSISPSWWWAESTEIEAAPSTQRGESRRKSSYFRGVAQLGIQAADALEHAHGLGVVHRDIKPGNLLVDGRGDLWVADFGLARLQGDSGLTATGDLLGTLRYMSPEQALAQHGIVDHRTDLYSLGATLYELMAQRPAFPGTDIQSLVHQITSEDPTPPSRFNPLIPRDLETIVLKAMAKEPLNRYATAQEMADDLRRFLDDQPILARRPSVVERAMRWSRRHRAVVVSAVLVLCLCLVCLSFSTLLIYKAMARATEESQARAAELKRAQANLTLAHQALDLYLDVAENWFPRGPGGERPDGDLLKKALSFYEEIATQNEADPGVVLRTFEAYSRIADIRMTLGQIKGPQSAQVAYSKAISIMSRVHQQYPQDERASVLLATVLEKFGNLLRRQSIYVPAEQALDESLQLLTQIVERNPADPVRRLALARGLNQFAGINGETGRIDQAREGSQRALDLLRDLGNAGTASPIPALVLKSELASTYINLGTWLQLEGKFVEAEEVYRLGLSRLEEIRAEMPGSPINLESLGLCLARLGELLRCTKRPEEAETTLKRAIAELEMLARDYPGVPRYRRELARVYELLGGLYWQTERRMESAEASRKAGEFDSCRKRGEQIHLNNLAWYLVTAPNPAARNPARALKLARDVVRLAPEMWEGWNTLGVALYRNGDWAGAKQALETSLEHAPMKNAHDGYFLAMALWRLGQREAAIDWLKKSEEWRLIQLPRDVELLQFRAEAEALMGQILGPGQNRFRQPVPSLATEAAAEQVSGQAEHYRSGHHTQRSTGQGGACSDPPGPSLLTPMCEFDEPHFCLTRLLRLDA